MNSYHDLSRSEQSPASLPRTNCTTDFSQLLERRHRASRTLENRLSRASSRRSNSNDSQKSQILYMSPSKDSRKRRDLGRSLSSISNGSAVEDVESPEDTLSRKIIQREIFEWQYVCQSGRPYWWSPVSKQARLNRLQSRQVSEYLRNPNTEYVLDSKYGMRRRAVSDSYLADPSTVHELAHLIAVQLLGACFTLPPDSINGVIPVYTRDEDGVAMIQDPRLISSLRMHTHFRYSPSFGHQARDTSPVQLWPGRYDGPTPGYSPLPSNDSSTPNIAASSPRSRRPRLRRTLHNTEGSLGGSGDDEEDYIRMCCNKNELDPTAGATAWYRREGEQDTNSRSITMPFMPSAGSKCRPMHTPECSRDDDIPRLTAGSSTVKMSYQLQSVLRSEPHHVFIQPVRELVVKRWKKFRRRLSGSLHSSLPTGGSDEFASASESSESSHIVSSGAKLRRLRAQERGDIHSSSVDDTPLYNTPRSGYLTPKSVDGTPHYNSPQSGYLTPNVNDLGPQLVGLRSLTFRLGDPLAAAASLVAAERLHVPSSGPPTLSRPGTLTPLDSISLRGLPRPPAPSALATCGTSYSMSEFALSLSKPNTPSFASKISKGRQRRRSMLSEVYTREEFLDSMSPGAEPFERSILSAMGSTPASPKEEKVSRYPLGIWRGKEAVSSPGPSVLPALVERAFSVPERPRISRRSSSGTQIFTTSDDGVEIDGLPAGLSRDVWAEKGSRREHTYL